MKCFLVQANKKIRRILYHNIFLFYLLFQSITTITPTPLSAQAFSWEDKQGNIFYGSTPPHNAKNIKELETRKLSRYSHDQVLSGFLGTSAISQNKPEESSPSSSTDNQKVEYGFEVVPLESSKPSISYNSSGEIISCKVHISNNSGNQASEISVAFAFGENILIPAIGPTELENDKTALYKIAPELLPLKLFKGKNKINKKPEVIIHSFKKIFWFSGY